MEPCDQSNKCSGIVIYNSRVVLEVNARTTVNKYLWLIPSRYNSRVVN